MTNYPRLVFDRDTGKPKGYGFCEFKDSETAMSAMRNLHGFELNGRALRVDFAENEKGLDKRQKRTGGGGGGAGRVRIYCNQSQNADLIL